MFIMQNDRAEKKSREKENAKTHWALNVTWAFSMLFRILLCIIIPLLAGIFEVIQALISAFQTRRFIL